MGEVIMFLTEKQKRQVNHVQRNVDQLQLLQQINDLAHKIKFAEEHILSIYQASKDLGEEYRMAAAALIDEEKEQVSYLYKELEELKKRSDYYR